MHQAPLVSVWYPGFLPFVLGMGTLRVEPLRVEPGGVGARVVLSSDMAFSLPTWNELRSILRVGGPWNRNPIRYQRG